MRPQADDADQDQVDRDEVVERARDHQDQDSENQRHEGADIDHVDHSRFCGKGISPDNARRRKSCQSALALTQSTTVSTTPGAWCHQKKGPFASGWMVRLCTAPGTMKA